MDNGFDLASVRSGELADVLQKLGQPRYRSDQVFDWIHRKHAASFLEMSNLPEPLRQQLQQMFFLPDLKIAKIQQSVDGTQKYLFELRDGNCIETVLMRYHHGLSACLSTQVGCSMDCRFCASTEGGKVRNLTAGEMLGQLYRVAGEVGERVGSVVLMGIGEPLDNLEAVAAFCDIVTDPKGYDLSARGITLSTCGLVPGIQALAEQRRQLTLSVSLHAATDEKRSAVMPVNKRYPLAQLLAACDEYRRKTGRRITYEYAVIHGQNDTDADAAQLAEMFSGRDAHLNLIPVNSVRGKAFSATRKQTQDFADKLTEWGLAVTVRRTLGDDIDAACGQLRQNAAKKDL